MTASKSIPLSGLDARYGDLLLRGARERFTIEAASVREAVQFTFLLHSYRKRMKEHHGPAKPEMWEPLYGAIVSRKDCRITIHPRTEQFASLFAQAGPGLTAGERAKPPLLPDADDFLAELKAAQAPGSEAKE